MPTSFYRDLLRVLNPRGWFFCYGTLPMFAQILEAGWHYRFEYVVVKNKPSCVFDNPKPMGAHNLIGAFTRPDYRSVYFDKTSIRTKGEPYSRHNVVKTGVFKQEHYGMAATSQANTDNPGYREGKTVLYGAAGTGFTKRERNAHPSQKPVSDAQTIIRGYCPPGGLVLDPFMGSGTTCVAARIEGRHYMGMEKDADYYKMASNRLASML